MGTINKVYVLLISSLFFFMGIQISAYAQENVSSPVVVLNSNSYVRVFEVLKTPMVITKTGELKVALNPASKEPKEFEAYQSPLPDANWISADFIDNTWKRQFSPVERILPWANPVISLHSASQVAQICLRWKFRVDDPSKVSALTLDAKYVGGMAVYVNGTEIGRTDLPQGALNVDTMADKYPDDLTVMPDGSFVQPPHPRNPLPSEMHGKHEERYRQLQPLVIDAKFLRKGVNVLAIYMFRSPINEAAVQATRKKEGGMQTVPGLYPYVGLKNIALTCAAGSAVQPNIARPDGIQVWSVLPYETVKMGDYDEAPVGSATQPIQIYGARNGIFNGRLIVSSPAVIEGLSATVSELKGDSGALPTSALKLRFAEPSDPAKTMRVPRDRFDGLSDEKIPSTIPLINKVAMCQLWLTVRVPKETKPGLYKGVVTVNVNGLQPVSVPVELTVNTWTVPDLSDYTVHNFGYLSEDAICGHYNVPRWSDRHFELMGESMKLMAEVNSRQAIVNLAINFYGGNKGEFSCSNQETMIRWIKQNDGTFKYDFSLFDKYLDTVVKYMGKPALLRVNCWNEVTKKDGVLVSNAENGKNFFVSVLDPATGNLETMEQPIPGTEASYNFWKPVLDEVRKKVEARGWWDVTALGWSSYCYYPAPEVVSMAKRIWPDGVWSYTAHNGIRNGVFKGVGAGESMKILQADTVWNRREPSVRGYIGLLDPKNFGYWSYTWRSNVREYGELNILRIIPEDEILRSHNGVSDFGADLFPVKSDKGRYYVPGNGRGTGGPDCSIYALMAPGPNGAISSERFEMLREGNQIAEAILYLQRSLDRKVLSPELEQKVNEFLDMRGNCYTRAWVHGSYERDRQLFALTGEVAQAVGQ